MKLFITIFTILILSQINAQAASYSCSAKPSNSCGLTGCGITKAQSDCVVKTRCNREILKVLKQKRAIYAKMRVLRRQLRRAKSKKYYGNSHRINLMLGRGPLGNIRGDSSSVETEKGGILGASYMYDISEGVNISGQIQSNQFIGVGIGLNF